MIPSEWSIGIFLSILAVLFGYLSWSKSSSYNRTDIEELLDNRFIGRSFGHEYTFDIGVSYTHTTEDRNEILRPVSIEKMKQESLPYTLPEANVVLWGKIRGLKMDHLKGVDEPSSTGQRRYDGDDYPIWNENQVESVTFRRRGLDQIECRIEFATSKVSTIRSALDDFDAIISVVLKRNHEANTEIPEELLRNPEEQYHFVNLEGE